MPKQNMAPWHRILYAVGGAVALAWGWSEAGSSRVLLMSMGAIGLIEAITGV